MKNRRQRLTGWLLSRWADAILAALASTCLILDLSDVQPVGFKWWWLELSLTTAAAFVAGYRLWAADTWMVRGVYVGTAILIGSILLTVMTFQPPEWWRQDQFSDRAEAAQLLVGVFAIAGILVTIAVGVLQKPKLVFEFTFDQAETGTYYSLEVVNNGAHVNDCRIQVFASGTSVPRVRMLSPESEWSPRGIPRDDGSIAVYGWEARLAPLYAQDRRTLSFFQVDDDERIDRLGIGWSASGSGYVRELVAVHEQTTGFRRSITHPRPFDE